MTCAKPMPDDGPWQLMTFKGRVLALSRQSGLYEVKSAELLPIKLDTGPVERANVPEVERQFQQSSSHSCAGKPPICGKCGGASAHWVGCPWGGCSA